MNNEYRKTLRLKAEHVDCFRRLRLPTLMRLFQECCIAHTEELGMGRDKTLDKGLLWVVSSESVSVRRFPEYDEEITLCCSPGKTLHYFFPRRMTVVDARGEEIIRVFAVWSLINASTRQIADPAEYGVVIKGENDPSDPMPVMALLPLENAAHKTYVASYSLCDINGHVNNASYIDLALDLLPQEALASLGPCEMHCVFKKEIPLGREFTLDYLLKEGEYRFQNPFFAIEIKRKNQ